jgi:hypothetical protein
MALLRSGAHVAALNPVTSVKLVKTIIYPKALYGCELRISRTGEKNTYGYV